MPGKNIDKQFVEHSFYHVYNRGLNKQDVFNDDDDYRVFMNLLKRNLGAETKINKRGWVYPNNHGGLELLSYCLMPNHFHLLIYTKDNPRLLTELMRSVIATYVMYFNKKTDRKGRLFEQHYRAIRITSDKYLWHISRYIHLNPLDIDQDYKKYPYSSIDYYTGRKSSDWVKPGEIKEMFKEANVNYKEFLEEYIERKEELKEIKAELY